MRVGILAEKIGMSRYYDGNNVNQAVTLLKVTNCKVVSIQSLGKNGYNSITLSHGNSKKTNKPFKSFLKKNNLIAFSNCNEFRVSSIENYKVGDEINASNFKVGQYVDVSAKSIGKGFAGGMKRHNFAGNRATHGVSISHRSHGSTGQCQDPGKVFKGKKMAGRLGNKKTTTQNLLVLKIDEDNNLLIVKGSVPGHKGSLVKIVDSVKKNQNIAELIGSQTLKNTDTEQTTEISSVENKDDINPNTKNEENQAKDSTVEGKTLSKTVDTTNESVNKNTSSDVNKDNT